MTDIMVAAKTFNVRTRVYDHCLGVLRPVNGDWRIELDFLGVKYGLSGTEIDVLKTLSCIAADEVTDWGKLELFRGISLAELYSIISDTPVFMLFKSAALLLLHSFVLLLRGKLDVSLSFNDERLFNEKGNSIYILDSGFENAHRSEIVALLERAKLCEAIITVDGDQRTDFRFVPFNTPAMRVDSVDSNVFAVWIEIRKMMEAD